ncbi:hypothetical protein JZ751_019755 [Albula glossodonta]|uniref:Secretory carrier-associated membrane protein n=1 Tax=Albula glossodonta TaxID=121402 RepID=A0A8T2N0K4_9TELE|nr:hypothetical protein JZ751_019755 [Albula glossodonta]
MSGFDSNPFADPVDVNPFQDPSVTEVTAAAADRVEEFNPFSENTTLHSNCCHDPRPHTTFPASCTAHLTGAQPTGRENNWPPLPKIFPIKPCFYQDFAEEIPLDYQRVCKLMYYLWMLHCVTLFLNLLACLAYFTTDPMYGVDFGLAILWFILFTPASFLCWYRPVYKAFKSDSSFSFFFFFFVFFFQVAVYIIQSVGIPKWGNSGWIASISMIGSNLAVAVVMMVVAGFFTVCAVLSVILLKMVHSKYRRTGASFQKAQHEFSQGVLSNGTFQNTAASVVTSAAQGAFRTN